MWRYCRAQRRVIEIVVGLSVAILLVWSPLSPFVLPLVQAQPRLSRSTGQTTHTSQVSQDDPSFQPIHALPVHYNPAPNAVLREPPTQVQITFSEHVNPDISKIVVVNPSNQEVDNRDSQVSADGYTMTVTLPLLPAGTYVVFWRTHSADDGHIAGGSYIFHIARADGTVPPLTGPLPHGTIIGGAGTPSSLDFPSLLGALGRWGTLLGLTLLLGMIFWYVFVQTRQPLGEDFRRAQNQHMRRIAQFALWGMLAATAVEIAAQALLLNGSLAGVVSLPLLRSILVSSRFGEVIFIRAVLIVLGLLVLWWSNGSALLARWNPDFVVSIFGVTLAFAVEYSGHGGSASQWWGPLLDLTHLLANGIWLGGLFTLALVIIPVLRRQQHAQRRAYLAASIPAFSGPALVAVALVTITGPLNATVRMTSLAQVWTTGYGIVLIIKSVLFLLMVAISYHHAFRLRPQLTAAQSGAARTPGGRWWNRPLLSHLSLSQSALALMPSSQPPSRPVSEQLPDPDLPRDSALAMFNNSASGLSGVSGSRGSDSLHTHEHVANAMMRWLRIEASIGAAVLLCAALLGPLAGTLQVVPATTANFGATGGVQTLTQRVDGLTVTLTANPGRFGTNTFTVVIKNPNGDPASNGSVFIVTSMVEMDMGQDTINLSPTSAPGTYSGQGEIPMAGHWRLEVVIRTREDPKHLHSVTFTISASF
jgi:copper transport protein